MILAPTWHPKPTKNRSMLALKSIQVGAWFRQLFFEGCLGLILLIFRAKPTWPTSQK